MAAMPLANGEKKQWDKWTIEAIPMYQPHPRSRSWASVYHDKGRDNGYILTYGGKRFYFSGDTEGIPALRCAPQLKNIDARVRFCMNVPPLHHMTPEEAADAVKAFHPKVAIPYAHYKGSDCTVFQKALAGTGIEVRLFEFLPIDCLTYAVVRGF